MEYAQLRKLRARNTLLYRLAHWPIWIAVFFLTPGPLTFRLFAYGFERRHGRWLGMVLLGTGSAAVRGRLPGVEPRPYILRFDEDKPNPLYRRVCYTFAWNAMLSYTTLNLAVLVAAHATGTWYMKQVYRYAYPPLCAGVLLLGAAGKLPRVGRSTRGEGTERRYFYGSVWAVLAAHPLLLALWKARPQRGTRTGQGTRWETRWKLAVFAGTLVMMGLAASRGALPRTRPILPGDVMIAD